MFPIDEYIYQTRITRYHVENEVKEGTIICLNFSHFFSKLNPPRKRIYHWTPCIFFYLSINAYQRIEIDSMRSVDNHLPFRNNSMNVVVVFIQFNLEMLLFVQDWNKNSCTKTVKICFPFFFSSIDRDVTISNSLSCKRPHVHVKKKKMPSISFSKSHFENLVPGCKKFIMWNVNMKKNRDCYRYPS